MKWISVKDGLPEYGQAVVVRRCEDNWESTHTLADGSEHKIWRWQAARFAKCSGHEPNNHTDYKWVEFGPGTLFGQDVSHWCAITDPLRELR